MFNKSLVTNSIAFLLAVFGQFSPIYPDEIFTIGVFAFSGAITNWLAVYMLFEKIPFLYGSGVIPNRFEEFKGGIRELIMNQFFTTENIDKFMSEGGAKSLDIAPVLDIIEYDSIFEGLINTIKESQFGSMLGMVGGEEALTPLKEPFIAKVKSTLIDMTNDDTFKQKIAHSITSSSHSDELVEKIISIVNARLDELTPNMVKEIIQDMIKKHLGWLVVWGGVFGGLIGLISTFFTTFSV